MKSGEGKEAPAQVSAEVLHIVAYAEFARGIASVVRSISAAGATTRRHRIWISRSYRPKPGEETLFLCHAFRSDWHGQFLIDAVIDLIDAFLILFWVLRHPRTIIHAHVRCGHLVVYFLRLFGRQGIIHIHLRPKRGGAYRALWRIFRPILIFNSHETQQSYRYEAADARVVFPSISWPEQPMKESPSSSPAFVCVGGFLPYKNFDSVIKAFRFFSAPDLKLKIIGAGGDRHLHLLDTERQLRLLAEGDARVSLLPHDPQWKEKRTAGDIFVHVARQEPFGIVMLEAFALGCRLVIPKGTFLDGLETQAGIYRCETLELEEISAKMKQALADPISAAVLWEKRLSERAHFSIETAMETLEPIYRRFDC